MGLCLYGFLTQRPILGQFSFHEALALVVRGIQHTGYAMELIETDPAQSTAEICRSLEKHRVDGFLLLGWPPESAERVLLYLEQKKLPAAAVGTTLRTNEFSWSNVDRAAGIKRAVRLLVAKSCRNIVMLDLDVGGTYRADKVKAFRAEIQKAFPSQRRVSILSMRTASLDEAIRIAREAASRRPRPDALVLTDNFFADAVMFALREEGIEPGADCRLIGLGDTSLAERCRPRLTHYSLMTPLQVRFGLNAVLERINNPSGFQPRHRLFEPELRLRDT